MLLNRNNDCVKSSQCVAKCPNGFTAFLVNSRYTCLKNAGMDRASNAFKVCRNMGAKVPYPYKAGNEDYRRAFFALGAKDWVALDINDVAVEGVWRNSRNYRILYLNWGPGQPNNRGNNKDYVFMRIPTGKWEDWTDDTEWIICENSPLI